MSYHLTPVRRVVVKKVRSAGKDVEKRNPWALDGNVNWYSHYEKLYNKKRKKEKRKTIWRFLKKLKAELPYDPGIPLLGIYPKKTKL